MKQVLISAAAAAAAILMAATPALAQSVNPGANGTYGRVSLRTGFTPDPYEVAVQAGGPVDAMSVGECAGAIASAPSFTLRYTAGDTLPLIISAESDVDTVLVVRGPDRAYYCDDDSGGGLNPAVRFDTPRSGRYQIWVGTFSAGGTQSEASLYISEIAAGKFDLANMPDPSLDPSYGAIDLASGFMPDPHTRTIAAGGGFDASVLGPGCVGWIATTPDYRVNWTAGSGALPLVFSVQSDADTTLVINDAQGNWRCDDDGGNGGLNPAITIGNPPSGQYDIWVGTFSRGDLQASTLNVSELYAQ